MVAYNFHKRFVPRIRDGSKPQTIRAERKRHARPGEEIQLYTGMRTRYCRLLGQPICEAIWPIVIELDAQIVLLNGRVIKASGELDAFAFQDGFDDWDQMDGFWRKNHPGISAFRGVLIRWFPPNPDDPFPADELQWGGAQMDLFRPVAEA